MKALSDAVTLADEESGAKSAARATSAGPRLRWGAADQADRCSSGWRWREDNAARWVPRLVAPRSSSLSADARGRGHDVMVGLTG